MPEERFSLTPEQQAVLDRFVDLTRLQQQEIIDAIAVPALIAANKPKHGEGSE